VSCRIATGGFGLVDADRRHVKLPRIGILRTLESTRNSLGTSSAAPRASARRRCRTGAGGCQVSFSGEVTRGDPAPTRPGSVVGVDLGVKSLAVLSTGEFIANPKQLDTAQRELRR
jgi:putative transposase